MVSRDLNDVAMQQPSVETPALKEYVSKEEYLDLQGQVKELKTEILITRDLTDDVVGVAGNTLTAVDSLFSFYFISVSVAVGIIGLVVQLGFSIQKSKHLSEATRKFIKEVLNNDDVSDAFIDKLVEHKGLRKNVNEAIDRIAKERQDTPDMSEIFHKLGDEIKKGNGNGSNARKS